MKAHSALAVNLAIAEFFVGTAAGKEIRLETIQKPGIGEPRPKKNLLDRFLAENNMPQELHDAPAACIALVGVNDPLAELDVVVARALENLVPGDGELRAARCGDALRHLQELLVVGDERGRGCSAGGHCSSSTGRGRVERRGAGSVEDLVPDLAGHMLVPAMCPLAARVPVAAEVDVAVSLDEVELQGSHGGDVVVERRVDVPCEQEARAVGVEEGDGGREVVVVVDEVGEVGHGLMALVEGRFQGVLVGGGRFGGIDDVKRTLPPANILCQWRSSPRRMRYNILW